MWLRMARDGAGGDPFFLLGDGAPFGRGGLPLGVGGFPLGVGGFPLGALGGLPGGSAGFFFPLGSDGSFFETFFGGTGAFLDAVFALLGGGLTLGRGGLPLGVGGFPLGVGGFPFVGGLPGGSAVFFFPLGGDGSFFETFFGGGPLGGGVPFFMVTFLGGGPLGGGGGI